MESLDLIFQSSSVTPVDFTISRSRLALLHGNITVFDAAGNLAYTVEGRHQKTLFDSAQKPLITVQEQEKGGWKAFRGYRTEPKDLIYRVESIRHSWTKTELQVFIICANGGQRVPDFRIKGSPFHRSCTIYKGNSIVAQTSLLYSLQKVVLKRNKFRLTIYPGVDHALIVSMLLLYFDGVI